MIVPDSAVLHRLCGTNDNNLKLIESFLKVPVFACGNELSVETSSPDSEQQFRFIVNRILDEMCENQDSSADSDLVRSVLNAQLPAMFGKPHLPRSLYEHCSITVPGGIRKFFPRPRPRLLLFRLCGRPIWSLPADLPAAARPFLQLPKPCALSLAMRKVP